MKQQDIMTTRATLRRLLSVGALSAMTLVASAASTVSVPGDFDTITEAILAAQNGDTILVNPGVYLERLNYLGLDVVIRSTDGPEATILDGEELERSSCSRVVKGPARVSKDSRCGMGARSWPLRRVESGARTPARQL